MGRQTLTTVGRDFFLSALYLKTMTMMILAGNTMSDAYRPVISWVKVNSMGPSWKWSQESISTAYDNAHVPGSSITIVINKEEVKTS